MVRCFSVVAALALIAAAPTAAQAQNNKPVRSGTYYEDKASNANTNALILSFEQTPADKFLNVTDVACQGTSNLNTPLLAGSLRVGTVSGGADIGREVTIASTTYTLNGSSLTYFSLNTKTLFKIGPGRFPSIRLLFKDTSGPASPTVNCLIVGNLSDD